MHGTGHVTANSTGMVTNFETTGVPQETKNEIIQSDSGIVTVSLHI